jgi:GntR family transcriptional regulator
MGGTNVSVAEPLYRQIAEDLRGRIESGELRPGAQMPTELELRERYSASRNTIRDAIKWLTTRGLVDARAGQGTFVMPRIDPFVATLSEHETVHLNSQGADQGLTISASAPRVAVQGAPGDIAAMLGLQEDDEVVSRQQARYIAGTLWSLQTSFYPRELVTRGAEHLLTASNIAMGVLAYLEQALGLKQVGYEDRIQVGPPNRDEVALFRLADDGRVKVITVRRTCYAAGDHGPVPFRVTITAFPADRNQLRIESGSLPGPT